MRFKVTPVLSLTIIIFVTTYSYASPNRKNLHFNKAAQEITLSDDLDYDSLKTSVERSISYYKRLSDDTIIRYPNRSFKKNEMISALKKFSEICRRHRGMKRTSALNREFEIITPVRRRNRIVFTGYYEESVKGSLDPTEHFNAPVFGRPNDLVAVDLSSGGRDMTFGKFADNRLVPYDTREEISTFNSLDGRAVPICFVNKIDLFFMQIEGSGFIELADGTAFRVMYDSDNGRDYVSIAPALKMPNLTRANLISRFSYSGKEIDRILNINPRYVFFRPFVPVTEGSLGEALVPGRSVAADPSIYPRGAVAYIQVAGNGTGKSGRAIRRFVCFQDTGPAIKGIDRIDIFFGSDSKQLAAAERFKRSGSLFLIVPKKNWQKPHLPGNEKKQASASSAYNKQS